MAAITSRYYRYVVLKSRLIDREAEIAELRRLAAGSTAAIAILYGRRRVGKTFLLSHAWPDRRTLYFLAAEATPALNRFELLRELATWSGRSLEPAEYPTWRTVFRLFGELAAERPLIVVLDEFQYLMGGEDDIVSQLVAVFDRELRGRPLLLVLCGSSLSLMEALLSRGQALFGRASWAARLRPFDYRDTARMVRSRSRREAALVYGIFGGTPQYLAAIDDGEPLADAVARTLLSPRGEVHLQLAHLIEQERGIRKPADYHAVLTAIAGGDHEVGRIATRTGIDMHSTRAVLSTLIELEHVRQERNFDAGRTVPFRHRIGDNALAFWFRFVHPNRHRLETGDPREVWRHQVAPHLDQYMGSVFERIAREAFDRYHERWGFGGAASWSSWQGLDRNRRQIEIDIVSRLDDGRILTGEVKWARRPPVARVRRPLGRDLEDLANSGLRWAQEALTPGHRAGHVLVVGSDAHQPAAPAGDLRILTLPDLYPAD